ncbi:alpha/beta hydrolase [soil metagenome]
MPYLSLNDINVYYETCGQGEPLLLIHGLGSSTRDWEPQVNSLAKHYQVIRFDLRGHGKTDKPNAPYSISLFTQDTAQLIQALGLQSVSVVGHSLGGMIAFQLALDFPQSVKRLIIVNSSPAVIFPTLKAHLKFYLRFIDVKLFGMGHLSRNLAKAVFPHPEQAKLRKVFVQRWRENDPKAYLNALRAFSGWNIMQRLPAIQCPTLIITADHDYSPISFKEFYTKLISNGDLLVIKNSYHMTPADQPEALNQAILNFMSKIDFVTTID